MISHLLDTCAFLDLITEKWKNPEAINVFKSSRNPGLLSISIWEIARRQRKGSLTLPCKPDGLLLFAQEVCEHYRIQIVDLDPQTCWKAEQLPVHHEDPFDRMILAAATLSKCPVFTCDRRFGEYPVRVLWHRDPF